VSVLIVGQAPGRTGDPSEPLSGPGTGWRLERLAGIPEGDLGLYAYRENLLSAYPGRNGAQGDRFPIRDARAAADRMVGGLAASKTLLDLRIILLGRNVARAFGLRALPYLRWKPGLYYTFLTRAEAFLPYPIAVFPHPSGVNRWWNDPENVVRAEAFLRDALDVREPVA
jgi:uracil-DNA glycosylase